MKKSKYILLTTLSPIISLPFLSASCITEAKSDNKMEKDIKINENTDEKNSSETMNNKQKQDKSSIDSKMEEKADNKTEKDIKINENTDEKNSSETMNNKQKQDKSSIDSKMEEKADNKTEKDIKINENIDEKNSSETMNNKQKQDKSSIESKMKEKTEKQDSKTNSEKQDSETDDSSNELTIPSESTPKDMPTENSEINDYLDKVKECGKEASEFYELLSKLFKTKYKDKIIQKIGKFEKIIKEFSKLYEGTKNNLDQIIEGFKEPDFKKALLELLNSYKESREEIKNAIKELKEIENESRF